MFGSYGSNFYYRTAAFYRVKTSHTVKMLLCFEGWLIDKFPIVTYRTNLPKNVIFSVNIFQEFFTIHALKLFYVVETNGF